MKNQEDLNLILTKIAEDDSNAFRLFYDSFYIQIYRFASFFVRSKELKEEIVSDVFFSVWQGRKNIMNIGDIKAYLYITTRNRALYYINNAKNVQNVAIDQISFAIASNEPGPEEKIIDQELTTVIKEAIDELPERCKLIFLMAKEENLKYREIANILSISQKTVNAQMVIALKKLAVALQKHVLLLFYISTIILYS